MKDPRLSTYILIIENDTGEKNFRAQVDAEDQTKALKKILRIYPHLRDNLSWDEILDCIHIVIP